MGACATKPGDLKVKGDAPLVVEDAAAAPPAAADEKAKAGEVPVAAAAPLAAADEKAKGGEVPVAAAEVDQADVSRRRSLSVLLKQESEASDGEADAVADHQEAEKVVSVVEEEPASAPAAPAGETIGSPQAPVQASIATTEHEDAAEKTKDDNLLSGDGDGDAQAVEEEKQVDPESVQVAVADVADAAVAEAAAAPSSEESKVAADEDGASA